MHRREALRIFAAGAVIPALSPELFVFFREAQPPPGYTLRTLTPHLNDTVMAMIDLIIPETDTPGAKGARVNEFIDIILTEWATPEERQHFLEGLAGVDEQCGELFGKDFVAASPAQRTTLLRAMDDAARADGETSHHGSAPPEERDTQLKGNFWTVFKGITIHGYYTSEIGFTQELKLEIIPGAQHGCVTLGPGTGDA